MVGASEPSTAVLAGDRCCSAYVRAGYAQNPRGAEFDIGSWGRLSGDEGGLNIGMSIAEWTAGARMGDGAASRFDVAGSELAIMLRSLSSWGRAGWSRLACEGILPASPCISTVTVVPSRGGG